ncbi:MAG TPA: hypothetical protein VF492_05700 [Verrucomicrobiae bacterium]
MKFTIYDLRFTSGPLVAYLNCRRRREKSPISFQFETRHLVSYKKK